MTVKYAILLTLLQPLASLVSAQNTSINSSPTLDAVADLIVRSGGNTQFVILTGITPGDEPEQLTQVSVSSNNDDIIDWLEADQTSNGQAFIRYRLRPQAAGNANIRVIVTDNGSPAGEISRTFNITVTPLSVHTAPDKVIAVAAPSSSMALKAYPNPFISDATIVFSTPFDEQQTDVSVYDMSGAKVRTLFHSSTIAGKSYSVRFGSAGLQPGIYIIRLNSSHQSQQLKLVLGR